MTLSFLHKIKLIPLFAVIGFLSFLEHFDHSLKVFLRALVLSFIFVTFFTGFSVESEESVFYRYNPVFVATEVLVPKDVPYIIETLPLPQITAQAYLAMDASRDRTLLSQNINTRLAPASTTKLMTALVALEYFPKNAAITVSEDCAATEGTKLGFTAGEELLVNDLIYSLLVNSANDAACILANAATTQEEFVQKMNLRAKEFGLLDTNFTNPVGFDGVGGSHYSSAQNLYILAKAAIANPYLKEVVKTKEYDLVSGKLPRKAHTTNYLLWAIPEGVGIKTGRTNEAGEVLIFEYNDGEKDLIIVVMGSEDRFLDTRNILDWVLASYSWD